MSWKDVLIPDRMAHLDKDHRGFPIPVIVLRDKYGRPLFQTNDEEVRQKTLRLDQCSICGGDLDDRRWSFGGPLSAFHPQGCYIDGPLHEECMVYAAQVCPYLAARSYSGRLDPDTLDPERFDRTSIIVDPTVMSERPNVFVGVEHIGQSYKMYPGINAIQYVRPNRPYLMARFWKHGRELSPEEAITLMNHAGEPT